jgi:hypothetical protein
VLARLRTDPAALTGRGLAPYHPAPPAERGDPEAFHAGGGLPAIAAARREVVAFEAPILESLAARRVAEQWGLRRLTAKVTERVEAALGIAGVHVTGTGDERVLWPDAASADQYRGARLAVDDDDRARRAIGEVPLVELVWLLRFWIDQAGPMTDRELLDHANRSLGFKSLGAKLRERLETALAVALTRRLLARTGDVIRPGVT